MLLQPPGMQERMHSQRKCLTSSSRSDSSMSSNEGGLEAVEQLQQHDHEHTTSDKRDLHKGNSVNAGHSLNLFQSTIDVGALPGTGKFLQSLLNSTSSEVSQSQMFAPGQHVVNFQRHVPAIVLGLRRLVLPTFIGASRRLSHVGSPYESTAWLRLLWVTCIITLIQGVLATTSRQWSLR